MNMQTTHAHAIIMEEVQLVSCPGNLGGFILGLKPETLHPSPVPSKPSYCHPHTILRI